MMKRDQTLLGLLLLLSVAGCPPADSSNNKGSGEKIVNLEGVAKAQSQLPSSTAPGTIPPPGPLPTDTKANPPSFQPPPIAPAPNMPNSNGTSPNVPGATPPTPGSVPPLPSTPPPTAPGVAPQPVVPAPSLPAPASTMPSPAPGSATPP